MHDKKERERGRNMEEGTERKGTREGEKRLKEMKGKRDEEGGWGGEKRREERDREQRE